MNEYNCNEKMFLSNEVIKLIKVIKLPTIYASSMELAILTKNTSLSIW